MVIQMLKCKCDCAGLMHTTWNPCAMHTLMSEQSPRHRYVCYLIFPNLLL